MIKARKKTKEIFVGSVGVGGENPPRVQSMTNTDTRDFKTTLEQVEALYAAGCEIVRVAVPDREAAKALGFLVRHSPCPIVADIHFDYRLALESLKKGAQGLRLNPGNIGEAWKVKEVVKAARERKVPIRIGVNAGSLDRETLARHGGPKAEAMVEKALEHISILEDLDFTLIKVSVKSSSVVETVKAYRMLAERIDYPLHLGVTEAGTAERGLIKSAMAMGILLAEGIGDTIRVSLTADPLKEVWAAYEILRALGLRRRGVELISCPTCGRCEIDLLGLAQEVDQKLRQVAEPIKVAVMGCVVNGPGEAREADVGIAGGRGQGLLFRKGQVVKKVKEEEMAQALWQEIERLLQQGYDAEGWEEGTSPEE